MRALVRLFRYSENPAFRRKPPARLNDCTPRQRAAPGRIRREEILARLLPKEGPTPTPARDGPGGPPDPPAGAAAAEPRPARAAVGLPLGPRLIPGEVNVGETFAGGPPGW